jgi:hypothetical protein
MDKINLQWLDLPIDVIEKQFNYLNLKDIITLSKIGNRSLNAVIYDYIRKKILLRKYNLDDITNIIKINQTFKDLIHIDLQTYTHFYYKNKFNSKNSDIEYKNLFVNKNCTKLCKFLNDHVDGHTLYNLGEYNIQYVKYIVNYNEKLYTYLFATCLIINDDYTDETINYFNNYLKDETIFNDFTYKYFYEQIFDGKTEIKDRYYKELRYHSHPLIYRDDEIIDYSVRNNAYSI